MKESYSRLRQQEDEEEVKRRTNEKCQANTKGLGYGYLFVSQFQLQ
jgi:hypothetical protein